MAVKIRLQRHGRKQRPFYFIVATDARERRDGKFIERLGDYNPLTIPATINLDREAAVKWIMNGAQPTNTVRKILTFKGVLYRKHLLRGVAKGAFTVEEADKRWADWLAAKEEKIQQRATNVASEKEQARRKRDETEKTKREAKASVKENVEVATEEVESPADEVAENVKAAVENVAAEQPVVEENPTVEEEAPQEESADNNEEKEG